MKIDNPEIDHSGFRGARRMFALAIKANALLTTSRVYSRTLEKLFGDTETVNQRAIIF